MPSPQVSRLSRRSVCHSTMPPKGAAARRGQQGSRVAIGSTRPAKNKVAAAKKKSASGSGEVAPAPTRARAQ